MVQYIKETDMAKTLRVASIKLECRKLREDGWSQNLIASTLNVSQSTVRYHTRDILVETKKKRAGGRHYIPCVSSDVVPFCHSAELAYVFG